VKLNTPLEWQQKHPEELCVYYGGPQSASEIARLINTGKHDILGYDSEIGQYGGKDNRPNVGGLISNQSFASQKWQEDAGQALRHLIHHIKNGKHASRIVGYHIGYGVSAESMIWGAWDGKFADYGPASKKRFYHWGLGKYGSSKELSQAWMQTISSCESLSLPDPAMRKGDCKSLQKLFRTDKQQRIVIDFEEFLSEVNAEALINFCHIAKKESGSQTLAGGFYGYTAGLQNAAEAGHMNWQRILDSESVDFIAAPNSYLCRAAGQPGAALAPEKSVALNGKVWINECDIRTHLSATDAGFGRTSDFQETQAVMWRDFVRSFAAGANCWWMDLFGGWFDDPQILRTIEQIQEIQLVDSGKRQDTSAEVALVLDERCFLHGASKESWFGKFVGDTIVKVRTLGLPVDIIRYNDIIRKKVADYKLLIFSHSFFITNEERAVIHSYLHGRTALWFYGTGILEPDFDLNNIFLNTGFHVYDSKNKNSLEIKYSLPGHEQFIETLEWGLPVLNVKIENDINIWGRYADGSLAIANKKYLGFNSFYSSVAPLSPKVLREIAKAAGCHVYIDADCIIDIAHSLIAIHTEKALNEKLYLPKSYNVKSIIDGQVWKNISVLQLNMPLKSTKALLFYS
jgi:hypothetical protein